MAAMNTNKRMPLIWKAHGTSMHLEDHGSCVFFSLLHLHLFYLLSLTGELTPEDQADIVSNPDLLAEQKVVRLRLDLEESGLRLSSQAFGGLGRMNMAIPYRGIIQGYVMTRSMPDSFLTAEERETASRGAELLINAIERKAPGLFRTLILTGLPAGFSFESWPQDDASTIPGQILRVMPRTGLDDIVSWFRHPRFIRTSRELIRDINMRHAGVESLN